MAHKLWVQINILENQNNRLINEVRTLREERDTLISCGYKGEPIKDAQPEISSLQRENEELKQKIGSIYLTKNIQHDTVRRLGKTHTEWVILYDSNIFLVEETFYKNMI